MNQSNPLIKGARDVQSALENLDLAAQVGELPSSTRTAKEAAHSIGCSVKQIAKSIVFKTRLTGKPILVITSGSNRVDETIISNCIGEKILKADPDFVHQQTGCPIGGVPPVGYVKEIRTFIDCDLLKYDEIWVAAGTPNAVFKISGQELVDAPGGQVIEVSGAR